jgi:antirestriction protein ArdC
VNLTKFKPLIDSFIADMEAGTAPWLKTWANGGMMLPFNGYTRKPYRGMNSLMLWATAELKGFTSNAWFSYKQMQELGGNHIDLQPDSKSSGQKATFIAVPISFEVDDEVEVRFKAGWVFNADQIENLPPTVVTHTEPPVYSNKTCLNFVEELSETMALPIRHGMDHACFYPVLDRIDMPNPQQFRDENEYWSTMFHELIHATSTKDRLNREIDRGEEELVAELGSAFLCAEFGVVGQLQHAEYLAGWAQKLKAEPQILWSLAGKAYAAHEWLIKAALFDDRLGHPGDSPAETAASAA